MTRAVLYARVSGDDRGKTGGANLADQLDLCRKHATERGYEVAAELAEDDRGASGATFDLPQLSKALELARTGQADVLIVRELDRLSRDLAKQLIVEQELKRVGATIEYVLYDFPDTPEGRLNKNLRAMLAEYEREKIKQRMIRGRTRRAKRGKLILHGRVPYGYQKGKHNGETVLEIEEDQAGVIRDIFRWYTVGDGTQGPMGTPTIAEKLTERGVPTWADIHDADWLRSVRPAGAWCRSVVRKMLANETYAGTFHYGKDDIPIEVPAIVDRETWEAARRQAKKNKSHSKRNTKYRYLLQHRLKCGDCGRAMRTKANPRRDGKRMRYYLCSVRDDPSLECANRHYYRTAEVDATLWHWLRGQLSNPQKLERSLRDYQNQREELLAPIREELAATKDLIKEIEAKRDRLLDQFVERVFDAELVAERKERYDGQLVKLRERLETLQAQVDQGGFSEERLEAVLAFADKISDGITEADHDFSKRRQLIESIELTCALSFRDGEEILEVYGALGPKHVLIVNPDIVHDPGDVL